VGAAAAAVEQRRLARDSHSALREAETVKPDDGITITTWTYSEEIEELPPLEELLHNPKWKKRREALICLCDLFSVAGGDVDEKMAQDARNSAGLLRGE